MADDIVLKLEIVPGAVPNAENVARALLAYVDMLKVAGSILDPGTELEVGLAGVEDGSDVFRLKLKRAEAFAVTVKEGMDEFPLLSKALLALVGTIGATIVGVIVAQAITPDPRIPADQMAVFEEQRRLLEESNELQREQNRFYGILHEEPAIERIDVMRNDRSLVFSIPQSEFAARSGLWDGAETEAETRSRETRVATWDVILIKAVLLAQPRRWVFAKDGLVFSARMEDAHFLDAIHEKSLRISLAEGIRMQIQVKYREEFDGTTWVPIVGSHRVSRVLDPLPPAPASPLFPVPDAP